MLVVETIAKIRRAYFDQKKPIKTICREFRVSRRVVRKVIRSEATEFRYERSRQPRPRIDPWHDQLDGLASAPSSVARIAMAFRTWGDIRERHASWDSFGSTS